MEDWIPSGEPGVSGDFWGSQEGCQGPSRPSGRNRGLPLRRRRGQGPHLAKRWEPRGFSRVAAGFSSYDGEFRLPLVLAQEVQSSIQLVSESWGLLSSQFRAKSPHLGLGPGRNVPLQGSNCFQFGCWELSQTSFKSF